MRTGLPVSEVSAKMKAWRIYPVYNRENIGQEYLVISNKIFKDDSWYVHL